MSRWAMMLPIVARRSPAISTPAACATATIVVPCGTSAGTGPAAVRRPGSRSGACRPRKSAKLVPPGTRKAAGSRPGPSRASLTEPSSLAALLHVGADELLGVLLEHLVDLVEEGVHVVGELLL